MVTNSGHGQAYDIVISDVLPAELFYVTSTVASDSPPYITFLAEPPMGATGVLTWRVNELWGLEWGSYGPKVATVTVVAQVTDTVGANLILTNTAAIPYYDSQPGDGPGPYTPRRAGVHRRLRQRLSPHGGRGNPQDRHPAHGHVGHAGHLHADRARQPHQRHPL